MSCCCKTDNRTKICNPCGFCMPPGVTGLTTCPPVGCDDKIDFCCAVYSGEDQPCSDIYNNDPLCDILYKLLSLAFPPEVCCFLEGTVEIITTTTTIPPTTTTTSSTTTTTSSTTTTTAAPAKTCNCFRINNPTERAKSYSWTDCNTLEVNFDFVGIGQTIFKCSRIDGFIADPALVTVDLGLCTESCGTTTTTTIVGPTTTTTTTTLPSCTSYTIFYYTIPDPVLEFASGSYVDCFGETTLWQVLPYEEITFCAQEGSVIITEGEEYLLVGTNGPCTP